MAPHVADNLRWQIATLEAQVGRGGSGGLADRVYPMNMCALIIQSVKFGLEPSLKNAANIAVQKKRKAQTSDANDDMDGSPAVVEDTSRDALRQQLHALKLEKLRRKVVCRLVEAFV